MDYERDDGLTIVDERVSAMLALDEEVLREPLSVLCDAPAPTLPTTASIAHAVAMLKEPGVTGLAVTRAGFLVGLVDERDVLERVVGRFDDLQAHPVTEIMNPAPEALRRDDMILFILEKMLVGGFRHVPIVDEYGRIEHLVSLREVVETLLMSCFGDAITNTPPMPPWSDEPPPPGEW